MTLLLTAGGQCLAQDRDWDTPPPRRLTIRPREIATATQNPAAGLYPLDSVSDAILSVAPQCAGTHPCPLLVFLPGGGQPAEHMTTWLRPVTDKYGMLLLAPTTYDVETLDAALKEVVRRFSVDPAKIAIIGRCASGPAGMQYGIQNPEVFSRIGVVSGGADVTGLGSANTTAEFYLDTGLEEADDEIFSGVQALQRAGYPVHHVIGLRGHEDQAEDYEFLGRWLHESWTKSAGRPAPAVVIDSLPVLTLPALRQMTAFWTAFAKEPDSIRFTARRAHLREVTVPVGTARPVAVLTDMPALAAQYPSVAADLRQAGLTAQEHDALRVALLSAQVAEIAPQAYNTPGMTSAQVQNLAFINAHPDELEQLAAAGIEQPDKLEGLGGALSPMTSYWRASQAAVDSLGSMGIWRMP